VNEMPGLVSLALRCGLCRIGQVMLASLRVVGQTLER
jgi:hypothetical protein